MHFLLIMDGTLYIVNGLTYLGEFSNSIIKILETVEQLVVQSKKKRLFKKKIQTDVFIF